MINDASTRHAALDILWDAGTLQTCGRHGTYFNGSEDLTAAYKLANYKLTQEGGATPGERRAMTDAIKAAYEDNSILTECERCHDD